MLRTIRWLALTASCAAASLALGAPGAQAQVAVTTLPASQVTPTTATLHGTIDTGGSATTWQLQYGATTQYGSATPAQTIPEGVGSVYVVALVTHLSPNSI